MSATAVSIPAIDLKTPATYPIRLGASILRPVESTKYAGVRYNHKPQLRHAGERTYSIKSGRGSGASVLVLNHNEDEYEYAGESDDAENSYVLVLRGDGKEKEAVLERLNKNHVFNLVRTPQEEDAERLRERYPQLSIDDEEDDGLVGDEDAVEEPADPHNPFDYRHFLKAAAEEKTRRPAETEAPRSSTGTPLVQHRAASSTPLARPTKRTGESALVQQKKRKATPSSVDKPNPKRAKAGQESSSASAPQRPTAKPSANSEPPPKIRVDRKASVRRPSNDDSGELILENDTPVSEKPPPAGRGAMALALSGQLGQGPISLRSAASSPANSRIASPAPARPDGMDEDGEFEIGVSSSPENSAEQKHQQQLAEEDEDAEDEEDEDADVEDLELPEPATVHKPSVSAATVTSGGDEDDLDAQLAAAMAEEEAVPEVAEDEEEESEEE